MVSAFLSHNARDKRIVRLVASELQKHGIVAWIDEAEIGPGDSLIDKIEKGIDLCDYVLAFISSNSIEAPWVNKELDIAITKEITNKKPVVIPIIVDLTKVPSKLIEKYYVDLSRSDIWSDNISVLIKKLGGGVAIQPNIDNLERFTVIDMIVRNDSIISLISVQSSNVFSIDPDGTRFYEKDTFLVSFKKGGISDYVLVARGLQIGRGCITEHNGKIIAFLSFKGPQNQDSYAMTGNVYYIRQPRLGVIYVKEVFRSQNWGWHPRFNGEDIEHFSFDGYYDYINDKKIGPASPQESELKHIDYISDHSEGIAFNQMFYVWSTIRHYIDTGDIRKK